jgi:aspartyl-tRNA(Asn)/glutamyl-tRNA(Gln) amidotransferase subunit A
VRAADPYSVAHGIGIPTRFLQFRVMSDPADLTLVELLPLLDRRELAARELVAACLRRVEAYEPSVRAFVTLTPELAQSAARDADQARAAGRPVGALAGIPVALKDLYCTRGIRTTASSRVLEDHVPDVDAAVWERLRAAGAGLMGKSTLHEFAYGTGSEPTRNPWDLERTPGGSSGGSGAALAARMVPVATGSDTGGSLRIPAAACGISSLRPTHGRISTHGALPLAPSFDTTGPMARRMRDVALLLRLLAGHDPRDPHSLDEPAPGYPDLGPEDLHGRRIGLPSRLLWDGVDEQIAATCRAGLQRLVDRGAELVVIDPPADSEQVLAFPGVYGVTVMAEATRVHADRMRSCPELYSDRLRRRLERAAQVTEGEQRQARAAARRWAAAWRALLIEQRVDAVASPTIPEPATRLPVERWEDLPALMPSKAWSITGFPALSVPVGLDDRGLPVGLQLAGLPEAEAELVGLGITLDEDVRMWERAPAISTGPG